MEHTPCKAVSKHFTYFIFIIFLLVPLFWQEVECDDLNWVFTSNSQIPVPQFYFPI